MGLATYQPATLFDTRETLTNSQATALTDANRSTLKAKFNELIAAGLIEAHGKGRGAFYARKKIGRPLPRI